MRGVLLRSIIAAEHRNDGQDIIPVPLILNAEKYSKLKPPAMRRMLHWRLGRAVTNETTAK